MAGVVAALAAALVLPITASAETAGTPSLSLPDATTALEVNGDSGEDSKDASLPVFNASPAPIPVRVTLEAVDPEGIELSGGSVERTAPAGGATAIPLTFTGLKGNDGQKVSGQLIVTGGAAPLQRGVTITPGPQPTLPWPPWPLLIVLVSLVPAALVFVLVAAGLGEPWKEFDRPAPGLSFDVSKSFATALTTLGAVATVVLAGVTYPPVPNEISKDSITELALLFAGLAVVGPFIYLGLRSAAPQNRKQAHSGNTWKPAPPAEAYADLTGGKLGLTLTCCATLVAVTGQLLTVALLSWELLDGGVAAVAIAVLVVLVIFLRLQLHVLGDRQLPRARLGGRGRGCLEESPGRRSARRRAGRRRRPHECRAPGAAQRQAPIAPLLPDQISWLTRHDDPCRSPPAAQRRRCLAGRGRVRRCRVARFRPAPSGSVFTLRSSSRRLSPFSEGRSRRQRLFRPQRKSIGCLGTRKRRQMSV